MPYSTADNRAKFAGPLNDAMARYSIDTPKRQAAFIAQIAHESGSLRYTREIASGAAYENRLDLGNIHPGDGVRYKGRGLIQITGRDNYYRLGLSLGVDLIANPELLEAPEYAALSAGWFWNERGLNDLADANKFEMITRRINGGLNGLKDREQFFAKAKEVMAA